MGDLQPLQHEIQYAFRDERLLRLALTHPSVGHERRHAARDNQRLEFLGDAVLQVVLSCELYERHPAAGEGDLTKARARLVNRRFLAEQGRQMGLGRHLTLGRGEEIHGGRERASTLADAFEAVLGALFLDGGFGVARDFLLRRLASAFETMARLPEADNPKGELQEMLQADTNAPPQYRVERTSGPDHNREFECAVSHRGLELGRGTGKSKKEAESQAALAALRSLRQSRSEAAPPLGMEQADARAESRDEQAAAQDP